MAALAARAKRAKEARLATRARAGSSIPRTTSCPTLDAEVETEEGWQPLGPELVVEVAYEHMQGDRFRHTAQFRRWPDDKKPNDCTYAQLEVVAPHELARIFAVGSAA